MVENHVLKNQNLYDPLCRAEVTPTKVLPSEGLLERVRMPSTDHELSDGIASPTLHQIKG